MTENIKKAFVLMACTLTNQLEPAFGHTLRLEKTARRERKCWKTGFHARRTKRIKTVKPCPIRIMLIPLIAKCSTCVLMESNQGCCSARIWAKSSTITLWYATPPQMSQDVKIGSTEILDRKNVAFLIGSFIHNR